MKIVSHHESHAAQIAQQGFAVINGITFTRGLDGKPTASVSEAQLLPFKGAAKFGLYDDDGQFKSLLKDERLEPSRPILGPGGQVVSVVALTSQQTTFAAQLDQMVKGPNVPPVQPATTEPEPDTTGGEDTATAPASTEPASTEPAGTEPATTEPETTTPDNKTVDTTDPAALAAVSRTELVSVADYYGVAHGGVESVDLIPEIVKAVKLAKAKAARALRDAKAKDAKAQAAAK